tara:strand:- start:4 stop:483 length:480 start_codon:yes stop_codon:yes gene_type:complete
MKGQPLSKLLNKNGMSIKHDLLNSFMVPGLLFKSAKYKIGEMSGGAAQQTNRREILGEILGDQYILNYTNGKKGKTITNISNKKPSGNKHNKDNKHQKKYKKNKKTKTHGKNGKKKRQTRKKMRPKQSGIPNKIKLKIKKTRKKSNHPDETSSRKTRKK